jgi:hypothetical protein
MKNPVEPDSDFELQQICSNRALFASANYFVRKYSSLIPFPKTREIIIA